LPDDQGTVPSMVETNRWEQYKRVSVSIEMKHYRHIELYLESIFTTKCCSRVFLWQLLLPQLMLWTSRSPLAVVMLHLPCSMEQCSRYFFSIRRFLTSIDHDRISTTQAMVVSMPSSSVTELSKAVLCIHRAFSLTVRSEVQLCR
jgi:hypothetical protein